MATLLDLSEETGQSPKNLSAFLRQQGIKVKGLSSRLPQSALRLCRAHFLNRGESLERALAPSAPLPDPVQSPLKRGRQLSAAAPQSLAATEDPVAALRALRGKPRERRSQRSGQEEKTTPAVRESAPPSPSTSANATAALASPSAADALTQLKALEQERARLAQRCSSLEARLVTAERSLESERALSARPSTIVHRSAGAEVERAASREEKGNISAPNPHAGEKAPMTLWRRLEQLGLADVSLLPTLAARLSDPKLAPNLLSRLRCAKGFDPFEGCILSCDAPRCREIAKRRGLPLSVPDYFCVICQGNERDRSYQWLRAECIRVGAIKLTVVGGSQDGQQALRELSRRFPGLDWGYVRGGEQIHQSRAQQLCRHASIIALWPNDHLTHRVSDLFRAAAKREGCPLITIPPGRQGVGALCEALLIGLSLDAEP